MFYNVRYKGHYGEYWTELYSYDSSAFNSGNLLSRSNSEYTVLSIPAVYPFVGGAEVDFQLEALFWHNVEVWIPDHPGVAGTEELGHYETRLALHSTSGWSSTQTLAIPESPIPTPESTPTSSPEITPTPYGKPLETENFGPILVVTAFGSLFAFGLVILYRIKRK